MSDRRTPVATRRPSRRIAIAAVLTISAAVLVATPGSSTTVTVQGDTYQAVIRRTSFGVPHVLAADLGGAGFGQGWAYAEDRFCDLADQIIKIRSQRSRWFGPGPDRVHLATDLAYLGLGLRERAEAQVTELSPPVHDLLSGYAAGYNAYLDEHGAAGVPGWCAGQDWLPHVTVVDLLAYQRDVALSASGQQLLAPIALAQPPGAISAGPLTSARRNPARIMPAGLARLPEEPGGVGSNGWALGAERTRSGHGMLLANPHFPWQGELRFWEVHLTVPGVLNVYGAALGGIPGVQIGFNDHVAWTHTVASGSRYTLYSVDLVPGRPTTYLVDGQPEEMTAKEVTISVDWGSGQPEPVTRTLWSTRYGPVLDLSSSDASLRWSTLRAITYRDANIDTGGLTQQWLGIALATDVAGVRDAIARDQSIPWVNTLATDDKGNAWYADASATPNLSAATAGQWRHSPYGVLDGSVGANAWVAEPGARVPGLVPFSRQPQLLRRDYVLNANDSHWMVNAHQPLTGYSPLQGTEGTPLSARSRENFRLLNDRAASGLDLSGLGEAVLSNDALTAVLLRDAVTRGCRARGDQPIRVGGSSVDLRPGCAVLRRWDGQFDVGSSGAVLWRETIRSVLLAHPDALTRAGALFSVDFDSRRPTTTPSGAPADITPLLTGLGAAMLRLSANSLALDVSLGDVQYTLKGTTRIPVPGSHEQVGIANVVGHTARPGSSLEPVVDAGPPSADTDLTADGYVVNTGTSYLMVVSFGTRGPTARALLTFGQSADPASPYFTDQTRLFTRGQLRDCAFTEAAIAADPELTVRAVATTQAARPTRGRG
ncbi:penicillin acylase family protein [Micromonospora lutea]|uniref:Aculeacin A acylase n=1 Tax=Micromonospora lutea TaxID=419825 RepID=A0ABQ4IT05_9ACTN|nr:penicillin acylase family protein [Micromonospora lutea]GIJ21052.1 aculeacin A acylase [Micromonospora lutea]